MSKPIASAEHIQKTGVLNQWYLVCRSSDLGAAPLALTRLGRKIALWRDSAGAVHAVEDICPHRRAPLSLGVVQPDGLACRYHGLTVDGAGVVVSVPPVHECPLIGQKVLPAYPAREVAGAVFLYFSDGVDDAVPEFEPPMQLTSPEWSGFIYAKEWACNYRAVLDNRMDPMHAIYLHGDSTTLAFGVKQSVIRYHQTPTGFYIDRDNQRGVNIDRTEMIYKPGNNFWIVTSIPYPKTVGGNFFSIISHLTPIDEKRTYVWFMRYQQSSSWRRDLWRFLYKNRLERRHEGVVNQDQAMIEATERQPDGGVEEFLIQSDIGVAHIRRLYARMAEEQARRINEHVARAAE